MEKYHALGIKRNEAEKQRKVADNKRQEIEDEKGLLQ